MILDISAMFALTQASKLRTYTKDMIKVTGLEHGEVRDSGPCREQDRIEQAARITY